MLAESLISQIQIALIGIVVVIGIFFIWKMMSRVEDKLEKILEKLSSKEGAHCLAGSNTCAFGPSSAWKGGSDEMPLPSEEDTAAAEEFMRSVFGQGAFMMPDETQPKAIVIEEEQDEVITAPVEEEMEESETLAPSEADADAMNPLSKSKLKKMNTDTLKQLCQERGLPLDGSKNVLIDRLLGLTRE